MATSIKCSLGIALSLLTATSTFAGEPNLPRPAFGGAVMAPGSGGYGHGYGRASTAHESILRGHADVMRANGERNLLNAEALRSFEEARSRNLDNELKAHDLRLTRKRMGVAERNADLAKIHGRRSTRLALNRASCILDNPSTAHLETRAAAKLRLAKSLLENGRDYHASKWLNDITEQFAGTEAAEEAAELLEKLNS